MGNCIRKGTKYKRHSFRNDGKCKHCGMAKRKQARTARAAFIRKHSRALCLDSGISRKEANSHARMVWDQQKASKAVAT